jgi:ribonuclease HII
MKLLLGIDDAGRGPVIGPMILAGCIIDEEAEKEFRTLGVRDSKQITPKRREFLAKEIKEKSKSYKVISISPEKIDTSSEKGLKLNELEAIACAKIINNLNQNLEGKGKIKVVIDCPSPSINKWTDFLKSHVDNLSNLEISCEHKADRNHISVSAASILAKSKREEEMDKLKKEFGEEMGSGYPSDPKTKTFLSKNKTNKKTEKIFRKSWKTWKEAVSKSGQRKLGF